MPGTVKCELLLYADDTCLIYQGENTADIENNLTKNFNTLCDWFIDNKLSIHLGEEKTKCILFSGKCRPINDKISITLGENKLKQYKSVTYLGCQLDEKNSGETMAVEVIKKINGKLKFLWRKHKFMTPALKRLLCNAIVQPHFDFAVSAWYPNLTKKLLNKVQICQNKCIRFCLGLGNRVHIGAKEFRLINWLPVPNRFEQCVNAHVFKFINQQSPTYSSEIFNIAEQPNRITRTNKGINLVQPQRKKVSGQAAPSFIGPKVWNPLPKEIKEVNSVSIFKHKIKALYFSELEQSENNDFLFY